MLWIWLIILLSAALVLFVLELFIPSGGILAILGAGFMICVIVMCFRIDQWLGAAVLAASVVMAPFGVAWGMTLWQKSYLGKKMIVTEVVGSLPKPQVLVGSVGTAVTELRPMGEVEIGDIKIEAQSEMGMIIPSGRCVQVLSMAGGIATVRELKETT